MQAPLSFRRTPVSSRAVLALSLAALLLAGCKPSVAPPKPIVWPESPHAAFLKQNNVYGSVTLLQFSRAGCPCPNNAKGFLETVRLNKDQTIPHLGFLCVDTAPNPEQADKYFQQNPPGYAVAHGDNTLIQAFGVTALPTTLLADKFGRVRYRGKFPDETKLANWAQELFEQKTDAGPDVTLFGIEAPADLSGLLAATQLPDLSGAVKPLQAYAGSKGVLVIFADVTCPFAGAALGELPQVAPTMAGLGVSTVVVNISDTQADVLKTYAGRQTGTPVLYDVTDATKENWKIDQVPTVVLFGTDGKAVYRSGAVWKDLAAATEKALGLEGGSIAFKVEGTGMG